MPIIKNKSSKIKITTEIRKYFDEISDLLLEREKLIKSEKEIFTKEIINELEYIRRNIYEIFFYCSSDVRYENPEDKEELKVWFNIIKETQEKITEVISATKQKELICAIILQGTEKLATSSRINEFNNFHTQFTITEKRNKKKQQDEPEEEEESAIYSYVNMLDYEFLRLHKEEVISAAFPEFKIEIMSSMWREHDKGNVQIIDNLIHRMYDASTYFSLLESMLLLIKSEISLIYKNPNIDFSRIYMAEEPMNDEEIGDEDVDSEVGAEAPIETEAEEVDSGVKASSEDNYEDGTGEEYLNIKKSKENTIPDESMKGLLSSFEFGSVLVKDNEDITLEGDQFKLYDKYINYLRDNFFKSGEKNG